MSAANRNLPVERGRIDRIGFISTDALLSTVVGHVARMRNLDINVKHAPTVHCLPEMVENLFFRDLCDKIYVDGKLLPFSVIDRWEVHLNEAEIAIFRANDIVQGYFEGDVPVNLSVCGRQLDTNVLLNDMCVALGSPPMCAAGII